MRSTIIAKTPHDSSLSFSRRHFHSIVARVVSTTTTNNNNSDRGEGNSDKESLAFPTVAKHEVKKKSPVSRFRSALSTAISVGRTRTRVRTRTLGTRVIGTLFGHRRGHVHFAFQSDSKLAPAVLIELAMPTTALVREMASGLVRIALECDRKASHGAKLLEETLWRAYCNGKKCGFAARRECGPTDSRVLKAVEPVSMGAGVLPPDGGGGGGGGGGEGEMMYMRAKFERVVGSKDSEAFYMMNPDGNSGPELSIYLLRV